MLCGWRAWAFTALGAFWLEVKIWGRMPAWWGLLKVTAWAIGAAAAESKATEIRENAIRFMWVTGKGLIRVKWSLKYRCQLDASVYLHAWKLWMSWLAVLLCWSIFCILRRDRQKLGKIKRLFKIKYFLLGKTRKIGYFGWCDRWVWRWQQKTLPSKQKPPDRLQKHWV